MQLTKVDFTRELSELYAPGEEPSLVTVPPLAFLMIDGRGDPQTAVEFRNALDALYAVAYATRFAVKRATGVGFSVLQLEALWWTSDTLPSGTAARSDWRWTAMIMQPEPVTEEIIELARLRVASRKVLPALPRLRVERFEEGLSAQVLHHGAYVDEARTVARLHRFITGQGYLLAGRHHEIYLNDPTRSAPERLRTVIRQPVCARV